MGPSDDVMWSGHVLDVVAGARQYDDDEIGWDEMATMRWLRCDSRSQGQAKQASQAPDRQQPRLESSLDRRCIALQLLRPLHHRPTHSPTDAAAPSRLNSTQSRA